MNFVAIDFETANEKRHSACSLGITVVENNKIVEEKYWLIKPHEMRFSQMNVWIHGLTEEDVKNERTFKELWRDIKPYLQDKFVIAHNAAFDMSVLRNTLDIYDIEYPEFQYGCTMVIGKNYFPRLENHKLNTIAEYLGIEFRHHNAVEDSTAAAKILIDICEKLEINSEVELVEKLGLRAGKVYERGYVPCSAMKGIKPLTLEEISLFEGRVNKPFGEDVHNLGNKMVVFTGALGTMTRSQAFKKIRELGGEPSSSVTKKTNYLVVALRNWEKLSFDKKSSKLRRAELLKSQGQDIEIVSEDVFLKWIGKHSD